MSVSVLCLFLLVPWVGLQCVIVALSSHTHTFCNKIVCVTHLHFDVCFPLTHLCQMYFPILINWTSPFPILGLLGGKLLFANSGEPDQTPHFAVSDLVLHCLLMSQKRTLGLSCIWVK